MRLNRSSFAAVLAALLVAGIGEWAPPTIAASSCASSQIALGRWSAVDVPPTPSIPVENSSSILSTSLVGQDPSVVLATDGVSVYRSTDSGCTWHTTYTLGAVDYWSGGGVAAAYSITNIVNGHSAAPASRQDVYLALSPNPLNAFTLVTLFGAAPPELMMVSHDGGQTFAPVQPAPSVANPIVPECLSAPSAIVVPPTDSHTIYLQCNGGLAQSEVDAQLAGTLSFAYRSLDGGQSWSFLTFPTYGQFLPGRNAKELWVAGQWTPPASTGSYYLAVWHSTDGGAHWNMSMPTPGKPGVGIGQIGMTVDMAPGARAERVLVYAPVGAYVTTDTGKHWTKLRGLDPGNRATVPVAAFVLRHSVYVITTSPATACKSGSVLLRYADVRGQPARTTVPSRWGSFLSWGYGDSFAIVQGPTVAFGLATFCSPSGGSTPPPKLLSFRPS